MLEYYRHFGAVTGGRVILTQLSDNYFLKPSCSDENIENSNINTHTATSGIEKASFVIFFRPSSLILKAAILSPSQAGIC